MTSAPKKLTAPLFGLLAWLDGHGFGILSSLGRNRNATRNCHTGGIEGTEVLRHPCNNQSNNAVRETVGSEWQLSGLSVIFRAAAPVTFMIRQRSNPADWRGLWTRQHPARSTHWLAFIGPVRG